MRAEGDPLGVIAALEAGQRRGIVFGRPLVDQAQRP